MPKFRKKPVVIEAEWKEEAMTPANPWDSPIASMKEAVKQLGDRPIRMTFEVDDIRPFLALHAAYEALQESVAGYREGYQEEIDKLVDDDTRLREDLRVFKEAMYAKIKTVDDNRDMDSGLKVTP